MARGWIAAALVAGALGLSAAILPLWAEEATDDKGALAAYLEGLLSDAGREVTIEGFEGALSSRATVAEITIADGAGVWLRLKGVTLDWTRSALLSGRVEVNALTADEVVLDRLPAPAPNALPAPEGQGFALPDLPVSVDIARLAATEIRLAPGVLGQPVTGKAEAALKLDGGEGSASLHLERQDDGPAGLFDLTAGYANETGQLNLSLAAQEGAGGIVASLLNLPGAPSLSLAVAGEGPLAGFGAHLTLATDGQPRLEGDLSLTGDGAGRTDFGLVAEGDLSPLIQPRYRDLLGQSARLIAAGARATDGSLSISDLDLSGGALTARGRIALDPEGVPLAFDLDLGLNPPGEEALALPSGAALRAASLRLAFDAAAGEAWTAEGRIDDLSAPWGDVEALRLSGGGTIARPTDAPARVAATIDLAATGLAPADPALARALGPALAGRVAAHWQQGDGTLTLTEATLAGEGRSLSATGRVGGLSSGFALAGQLAGSWDDLAELGPLAGLPGLRGRATIGLAGEGSLLGSAFDARISADAATLALGEPHLDAALALGAKVTGGISRGPEGTQVEGLRVTAKGAGTARLDGLIASAGSALTAELSLPDLSAFDPRWGGGLAATAGFTGTGAAGRLTLRGTASDLALGQPRLDPVLAGPGALDLTLSLRDGQPRLETLSLDGVALDLTARGGAAPDEVQLDARLADLALVLPDFPGPLSLSGPLRQEGRATALDLTLSGPGGLAARLSGRIDPMARKAALDITGQGRAELLNPFLAPRALAGGLGFELRLDGPPQLEALSGRVTLAEGRLADPGLNLGLQAIDASAELAGGRASLIASAAATTGGQLSLTGNVALAAPHSADLALRLETVGFKEPRLYETTASGDLTITGPLAGGATIAGTLHLGRTELRIPSTGLSGAEPIPAIHHLAEPPDVAATRARAGLGAGGPKARGGGAVHHLDIDLRAPNQVFLRGRGLDAELGGALHLGGTTARILPDGAFDLIRGRLDLVGRRLTLTEARLQMEGAFVPRIDIAAVTEAEGITSTLRVTGPAAAPELELSSVPDLPEEEVLAQILFGRRLENLSALQAAELAMAIRTLAGKGGEGIVGRLRAATGLDNLDITTDETGQAAVTAGKYLSDKAYGEITLDQQGTTRIDLNYDLKRNLTVKGTVDSTGDSGIGIWLEKDY